MTTRLGNSSCLEQRGVIRFLLAESVKSCEILSRMQRQYGPSCMSRANFYKWVQAFKDGRESITDDLRVEDLWMSLPQKQYRQLKT